MYGQHLNAPVVGISNSAFGQGYALVASDGGIFNFSSGIAGPPACFPAQLVRLWEWRALSSTVGSGDWEISAYGGIYAYSNT